MIEFQENGMDPHSSDVLLNGQRIGYLHWHPPRSPLLSVTEEFTEIPLEDLRVIVQKLEQVRRGQNSPAPRQSD